MTPDTEKLWIRTRPSWRVRLLRRWTMLALPWLLLVAALSIYDHQRAIGRMAASLADGPASAIQGALHWAMAASWYAGDAILFYGALPAGLTFVLYVLLLPLADGWAARGSLED